MAETRMIKTKIWSDDWFGELSVDARYLYLYLLTNKNTHICGYYKLSIKEICFMTGLTSKRVETALEELTTNVAYEEGWVIIKNYPRYQNVSNNAKVQASIERELKNVPENLLNLNHKSKSNSEAIDSLSIPYENKAKNKGTVDKPVDKERKKYGEFKNVALSDDEKEKLKNKYGRDVALALVEELSVGIKTHGYTYKDHYAAALSWARKKGLQVQTSTVIPKVIPEMQPNGTVRLIPNPEYHE